MQSGIQDVATVANHEKRGEENLSQIKISNMNQDQTNRTGQEYSFSQWSYKCPLCKASELERTKGTPGDWVKEYTCKKCNSIIEYNEGDKMGGQFDYITIIQDNYSIKNKNLKSIIMGYMTDGLTFNNLRGANLARLPQFKNSKGEPAHEKEDGSDWSLAEWMNAGELGEAANIIKKVRRGDMTIDEARPLLAEEFADIVTYLDITALQAGVNLGQATMDKFNKVSRRVGSNITLDAEGWHRKDVLTGFLYETNGQSK